MRHEAGIRPVSDHMSSGFIVPFAPTLMSNELVLIYRESNIRTEDLTEEHRWKLITVQRNGDRLYEFPISMGPSYLYPGVSEILIVSMFEDTVDAVMDMADNMRDENQISSFLADREDEGLTLVEEFIQQEEQQRKFLLNQSQFGPTFKKERTGFIPRR
jgi:hypothetical protein